MNQDQEGARTAARSKRVLDWAYSLTAVFFFVYLFVYYATSQGGPALLAFALVPVTYILYTLDALPARLNPSLLS